MSRRSNVVKYMTEWRQGYWSIPGAPADSNALTIKVADEVVSYCGLADTTENVRNYAIVVEEMFNDGGLLITTATQNSVTLELP